MIKRRTTCAWMIWAAVASTSMLSCGPALADTPAAPRKAQAWVATSEKLLVVWHEPLDHGGTDTTSYKIQWRRDNEAYSDARQIVKSAADTYWSFSIHPSRWYESVVNRLVNGEEYTVRVIATNPDGDGTPSAQTSAVPLSIAQQDANLRSYIANTLVPRYETSYPWVRDIWGEMQARNTIVGVTREGQGHVGINFGASECTRNGSTGLPVCRPYQLRVQQRGSHADSLYLHEMAHLHTLGNSNADHPGPTAIGFLYVQQLPGADASRSCAVRELYADLMWLVTQNRPTAPTSYWDSCLGRGPSTARTEALATVRTILRGDTPTWFNTFYAAPDAGIDRERVWSDVKALSHTGNDRESVVALLRNEFGGYCYGHAAYDSAFGHGLTRDPWRDSGCLPATVEALTAVPGAKALAVSWDPPTDDGGAPVEGYKVQWRSADEGYDSSREALTTERSHTIRALSPDVIHTIRITPYNANGDGTAGAQITATPIAFTPLTGVVPAATVESATLVLAYDQPLAEGSIPATSAFAVSAAGTALTVAAVEVAATKVTLGLGSAVTASDAVTVSYTVPAQSSAPRIESPEGLDAPAFAALAATNNTTALLPTASVDTTTLVLDYDQTLDDTSVPATSAFSVTVEDSEHTVSAADVADNRLTLTLEPAVAAGDEVTVSYTVPETSPARSKLGSYAAPFADVRARNDTRHPNPALVTITARHEAATLDRDSVYFDLRRTGPTDKALPVNVVLTQTATYLADDKLSQIVTFTQGSDTAALTLFATWFKDSTTTTNGNIRATIASGTAYFSGAPETAATNVFALESAFTYRVEKDAYTFAEDAADTAQFTVIVRTERGAPKPRTAIPMRLRTVQATPASAEEGVDYAPLSEFLEIAPSEFQAQGQIHAARRTVAFSIVHDGLDEENETLTLELEGHRTWLTRDKAVYANGTACPLVGVKPVCRIPVTIVNIDESITAPDKTAPQLASAAVAATTLTLTFSEALDATSKPATQAFAVTVAGDGRTVDAVALSGSEVALTLASAVTSGETVTVGYTAPTGSDASPLKDASGNATASFTGEAVTNETAALPSVSIAAATSPVTEGTDAAFTLTRTGPATAALTVRIEVTESGAVLTETSPSAVTFEAESATAALELATADDEAVEDASTVTVTVAAGDGWTVDGGSAAVTVEDDDAAPVVTTSSPIEAPENDTGVATFEATDEDTPAADLVWSLAGGGDAGAFTLTAAGALSFKAAKDFEAPDDANGDSAYEVTVRVSDGANTADAALAVRLADVDEVAPTLTNASVNGAVAALTFSEALDQDSAPEPDAFGVTVAGDARTVTEAAFSRSAVELTLASAVESGETVTVGYTVPTGANAAPLKDRAGNAVASFTGEAVTNGTPALPAVSIVAGTSPVTEGADATFTLTRSGSVSAALTVTVEVTESGAVLAQTSPAAVTFEAESATAALELATADDGAVEDASTVTVTVASGDGYTVASERASAEVAVEDDDAAPVASTASALSVAENATAVVTLAATDTDTDVENISWSIPAGTTGGADAGAFTLTRAGALAFKAAKDFEAPDDADGDGTYEVTVRVTDGANPVGVALKVTLVDVDEIAPTLTAASVSGTALTLTFSEALNAASKPPAGAFTVTVAGDARTVDAVALSENEVALTLASAVASGETVTVGYTAPAGANAAPLKDAWGNAVAGFTDEAVTNETPAPGVLAEIAVRAGAAYVEEGSDGVFTLTRSGPVAGALTVSVAIEESATMLAGTAPASVAFAAGVAEVELAVPTVDDGTQESDSTVTVRLLAGTGYGPSANFASASVTVLDDDAAPPVPAAEALWSADMQVVEYTSVSIGAASADLFSNQGGSAGLRAKQLWYHTTGRTLRLGFTGAIPDAEGLTLHLGARTLALPAGSAGEWGATWNGVDIDWTHSQTLSVRLTAHSADAVPADASLKSLTVSGADLSPGFAPGKLIYQAVVGSGTESVTVSAAANDGRATVAIKPEVDADPEAADHQVTVPFGETLIAVTVTAEDGETQRRYRVVAIRAPPAVTVSFGSASYTATEGGDAAAVAVVLSGDPGREVTIPLTAVAGGGADADDYAAPASVTFDSGEALTRMATVTAAADDTAESGESVVLGFATLPKGVEAGATPSATVTLADAAPANTAPTGLPSISGTPKVGEMLTASISDVEDEDGLDNATFAYQWLAHDDTDDTELAGATGSTHEVAPTEVGKTLKVRVTFTDDKGTQEVLVSVATEAVLARAPDAPGGLAAATAPRRAGELDVSWTAPASDGGSEVTGYKVQWKSGAEAYDGSASSTRQALVSAPAGLSHTIAGLTVGTACTVRVLAVNDAGDGAAAEVGATAEDRVVPTLTAASVNGTALALTFSEALDAASKPAADAFAVTVAGDARTVDEVALSGSAVELTLASAVVSGETVTVGYTALTGSDASPLKDAAGNAVASFTGEAVTNGTPALPAVSIVTGTSPVTEGADATFTLTRSGSVSAALTVNVEVTESGAVLAETSPSAITFEAESATAALDLATGDDEAAEGASTITVTVVAGDGWTVDAKASSATVTVEDDDAAPVVTTALALPVAENTTAVATLAATDADTDVANLAWSIPAGTTGGADAGAFALTGAGALTFKTAKDFEAPDDANENGTYELTVRITDGANPVDVALKVTLVDVDETIALTAQFRGGPGSHDGTSEFSFEVLFSEPVRVGYAVLKNHSFAVTDATVTKAKRVMDENGVKRHDLREIHIQPNTQGDVTVVLAGGRACGTTGAICTADEKVLSGTLRLTVPGPASTALAAVSVAGDTAAVTEGARAAFTLARTGDVSATLTVTIEVTESGAMLAGDPPTEVTFEAQSTTAALALATVDDETAEAASVLAVAVASGEGYTVASEGASAEVTVADDDAAPEVTTALALAVAENATAVATLEATDADTDGENLAWSIADGADAGAFALTAAGALSFKAAKDFEAPDDADGDGTYEVTVRVTDGANPVDVALTVGLTDVDEIAAALTQASVNATALTLTFSETLHAASKPTADAFTVTVAGDARTVDAVSLSGSAVELTLTSAVASGETVTVGYTVPTGANAAPLKDAAGNDVAGFTGEAVSNQTPAPVNAVPTGLPEISGTPKVGEVLTASESAIEDPDGLENATFAWQWLMNDSTDETKIAGATGSTHEVGPAEVGKTLKVQVTFTDDGATEETLTSAATEAVAARAPDAPGALAAATAPGREGELDVTWTAPTSNGGSEVTGYNVQWKSGTEAYDASASSTRQALVMDPGVLTYTITGLTVGTAYTVQVLAVNDAGDGAAAEVEATARDRIAPTLTAASVNGSVLTLSFSEALDATSKPSADAFAATVADAARTVDEASVSQSAVELTLASAVASGETVTVGYTVPTGAQTTALKDAAGNAAAAFTGEAVTNETQASNTAPTGLPEITGTAHIGEVLTASVDGIEDADGLDDVTFAYQWFANDGQNDTEIEDATGATHEVAPAQIGKTLKVRVTFTDEGGTQEALTSAATEAVQARPVEVSIAAVSSPVVEGSDAVFTLTRTGDASAALTVGVSVSAAGTFLDGAAPTQASFAASATTATLRVATENDGTAEADGRVSASVSSGTGYTVADGAGSAGVDVFDNDKAAPTVTVLWSADMTVVDYGNGAIGAGSADLLTNIDGSEDLGARSLWYWTPERKLRLAFTENIPEGEGLTLHLGSRALALPEDSSGDSSVSWDDVDVDWSDGETIAVRLTAEAAAQVPAGPGVSVADARVQEAAGAQLSFRVTLDAAQAETVSVRYATADGTAVAGADYVAARGAVRFAPGQTVKTVKVLVLEDAHDDTGETLTLKLSSPFGAQLSDGQATGTIINTDPVPKAWLARFGRTVAGHVVDAISGRFEGSARGGSHVTLGGQRLILDNDGGSGPGGTAGETSQSDGAARDGLAALGERIGSRADSGASTRWEESGAGDDWMRERGEDGTRSMTGRELLLGSSFLLPLGGDGNGAGAVQTRWTAWGQAAASRFDGEAQGLSVDGEVSTFTLGADAVWARWLAGVAVSLSEGEGGFRDHPETGLESRGTGKLESTLTSVHPYLRYEASERVSLWGILGYGTGELTLAVEDKESWTTDTTMEMGAAGARGVLVPGGDAGIEIATRTDAQFVRMRSEAARGSDGGNLAATQSDTSRVRVMLEGSRAFALEGGGGLTPSLEVGLRHDGGDAETGTGIEVGGGLSYTNPTIGITVDAKARGLVAHEDTDYAEWGASGSVRIEPDESGRGLSLTLAPSRGADTGGAQRLWSAHDARTLSPHKTGDPQSGMQAALGYGIPVFGGRGITTPHVGWSRAGDNKTLHLGQRLKLGSSEWSLESEFGEDNRTLRAGYHYRGANTIDVGIDASRSESDGKERPRQELRLNIRMQW